MSDYKIATKCVHAGYAPGNKEPITIPIVQSTTFKYQSGDAMGKMFDLEDSGYFYTRLANPTHDAVAAIIRSAIAQGYAVVTGGEPGVARMAAGLVARQGGCLIDILGGGMREHLKDDAIAQLVGEGRAAVLSLEHPDAMFTVSHAIARNRLLFALSDAAFIFNTDGRRGELDALQNRTCDWIYAWEGYAGNRPLIARGAVPFDAPTDERLREMSRHWASSSAQQLNMFDML